MLTFVGISGDFKILSLRQDCTRSYLQEDKMISLEKDHFHIDLSIKVTFWAGPIPVTIGGSMLYEQSSEDNQEKEGASFSFTETTETKMLSMDHFKFLFDDMSAAEEIDSLLEGEEATHVISGEKLSPLNLSLGITFGSQASLRFKKREETGSGSLKADGTITAEIDLFVAAVGAEVSLDIDHRHHTEANTMQCEFIGNYTGENATLPTPSSFRNQYPCNTTGGWQGGVPAVGVTIMFMMT